MSHKLPMLCKSIFYIKIRTTIWPSNGKAAKITDEKSYKQAMNKISAGTGSIDDIYVDGKKLYLATKAGNYNDTYLVIIGANKNKVTLRIHNRKFEASLGVVLDTNSGYEKDGNTASSLGSYVVNRTTQVNRGDTILFSLAKDKAKLFNPSYRISVHKDFLEKSIQETHEITTSYVDDSNSSTATWIDALGMTTAQAEKWKEYVDELKRCRSYVKEDDSDFRVLVSTGDWGTTRDPDTGMVVNCTTGAPNLSLPTTGLTAKNNNATLTMQRILADPYHLDLSYGDSSYVSVNLADLNGLFIEIPDCSNLLQNNNARYLFEMKDNATPEETGNNGYDKQCQRLYNSLGSEFNGNMACFSANGANYENHYDGNAKERYIGIPNNLFLQCELPTIDVKDVDTTSITSSDKGYTSSRARALNVVQEAAHNDKGQGKGEWLNNGCVDDKPTYTEENHFHYQNKSGAEKFGRYNNSTAYPTKCLKGASSITMTKGLLSMYTIRHNNTLAISAPNNQLAINALGFLNTSGFVTASKSTNTIFSSLQLIQSTTDGRKDNGFTNHDITLDQVLNWTSLSQRKAAKEKESVTTNVFGSGLQKAATDKKDYKTTNLSSSTLGEKLSTEFIMYDLTLKKTYTESGKQVAVFQTSKYNAGFRLVDPSGDSADSHRYSLPTGAGTLGKNDNTTADFGTAGDKIPQIKFNKDTTLNSNLDNDGKVKEEIEIKDDKGHIKDTVTLTNTNAFPASFWASKEYNYCINKDSNYWITSNGKGGNKTNDTNCKITYTDGSIKRAFVNYNVGSAKTPYNNGITVWNGDVSNDSLSQTCCTLDLSKLENLSNIKYIDTYIDVCYNNNGFRQVRYPIRLVLH